MTGPTFDDGSGFGRRASPWFAASLLGVPALFIGFVIIGDPEYTKQGLMAIALGGLWMLFTFGNGIYIAGMGRQAIHPRDPKRVVAVNIAAIDTDGRGKDFYSSIPDWQIQQCEDDNAACYAAEMRAHESNQ